MARARCLSCGMLTETLSNLPADEKARLSILADLKRMQRKRGYFVNREDREINLCDECVAELVKRSTPDEDNPKHYGWGKR